MSINKFVREIICVFGMHPKDENTKKKPIIEECKEGERGKEII